MSYDVIRSAILISLFQIKLPMINQCKIKPESLNGVKDYDRPALTSLCVLNVNWPDSHNQLREQHPKYIVILLREGGEIRDRKTLNLARNIISLQVWVDFSRFSPCMINLSRNKNICCGLKKVVAKSRARIYSEQQILGLLLVFHQAHNLSRNKCALVLANQPLSALHFFNPQQMFFLRVNLITQSEKRETSTRTCNETMLRHKLRVFVSRLSPP